MGHDCARQLIAIRAHQLLTVVGRETSPPRVVIAHEPVKELMPAMTMPFDMAGDAPAIQSGDRIIATLVTWRRSRRSRRAARSRAPTI